MLENQEPCSTYSQNNPPLLDDQTFVIYRDLYYLYKHLSYEKGVFTGKLQPTTVSPKKALLIPSGGTKYLTLLRRLRAQQANILTSVLD